MSSTWFFAAFSAQLVVSAVVGPRAGRTVDAIGGRRIPPQLPGLSRNLLRYKAMARAATFVDLSEYLTTQTCPDRRAVGGPKRDRRSRNESAGLRRLRHGHVAAARNILRLGGQALAEGSSTLSA
jgi:hypothetical protein